MEGSPGRLENPTPAPASATATPLVWEIRVCAWAEPTLQHMWTDANPSLPHVPVPTDVCHVQRDENVNVTSVWEEFSLSFSG